MHWQRTGNEFGQPDRHDACSVDVHAGSKYTSVSSLIVVVVVVGAGVGAGVGHVPPGAMSTALLHEPPSWHVVPQ